ncbi:unnamed protein product [Sphagnum jensenii]|uniref:Uncharacterized protein n=1 Tax=Sphagnum jensenii TaxID=128206 RepID=A0ABP0VRB6_9BRYO
MGPKAYAANKALDGGKELSWMDRMCLKMETFCELGEYGQGPTLLMQEMEMQLNSLGSGLRKLANEANEFVQELLMPPTMNETEKAGEKGLDLKQQCNVRIAASQQKKVKQPTGGSVNLNDDTCNKITTNAGLKDETCHSGILDFTGVEEQQSSLQSEGSFEATWDWPQEPFDVSEKAEGEQQLAQDMGQASCSSVGPAAEAAPGLFGSVKEQLSMDADAIKAPNEMVKGEEQSALSLSKTEEQKKLWTTMSTSSLDGWEGSDIIICEENIEPDTWHDWELV